MWAPFRAKTFNVHKSPLISNLHRINYRLASLSHNHRRQTHLVRDYEFRLSRQRLSTRRRSSAWLLSSRGQWSVLIIKIYAGVKTSQAPLVLIKTSIVEVMRCLNRIFRPLTPRPDLTRLDVDLQLFACWWSERVSRLKWLTHTHTRAYFFI